METASSSLVVTALVTVGVSGVFQTLKGNWGTWVVRILSAAAGAGAGYALGQDADNTLVGALGMTASYEWLWSGSLGKALNLNGMSRLAGFAAEALSKFAAAIKTNGGSGTGPVT